MNTNLEYAQQLDLQDELAPFRKKFVIKDPEIIYLDGNSLGRLPKRTQTRLQNLIDVEWGSDLIRSWKSSWFTLPERIGGKIAKLTGAGKDEVIIADSTSINLFKLVVSALRFCPNRTKIITDDLNFPSDIYILAGAAEMAGPQYQLKIINSPDGIIAPYHRLTDEIDDNTALVCLSHTTFKSGFVYDMAEITEKAHKNGVMVLWDLSHSVGAVPVFLNNCGVDLAVGCCYKYMNSGPGAPAFLYVRKDLQNRLKNPITGWFGQEKQFDFKLKYQPHEGIRQFLTGTPAVISLAAIEDGVDLILEAGMDRLRRKSIKQTEYLIYLWETLLKPLGFYLNSPQNPEQRGSHISLGHEEGYRIDRTLIEDKKVIPDFRHPDSIRMGLAPIYTSFSDIYNAVIRMKLVVVERLFENYSPQRESVT